MFRHLVMVCTCLCLPGWAMASPNDNPQDAAKADRLLTLEQALTLSRDNHPSLKAVEAEIATLDGRVSLARLAPPLSVSAELEDFAGSDQLSGLDSAELTLSLGAVLELGDKAEARAAFASSQNDLRLVELRQQRRDVFADVAQNFIVAAIAQARVDLAGQAVALAKKTREATQRRNRAGAAAVTELQRATLQEQDAILSLQLAQRQLRGSLQALQLLMGVPDSVFSGVKARVLELPELLSLSALQGQFGRVAEVMAAEAGMRIAEAELRLAQAASRPDLELSGGVRQYEASGDQALVVGISVPLGSRKRAAPARQLALGQREVQAQSHKAAVLRVSGLLTNAWYRLSAYQQEVQALQGQLLMQADDIVKATEAGYRRGRYSLLELNAAQADALRLRSRSLDAAAGFHKTLIEIERLLGLMAVSETS